MAKSISTPTAKTTKADSLKTKSVKSTGAAVKKTTTHSDAHQEDRESMIRYAAYFLAEQDGFQPGRESDYWVQAEKQIDQLFKARHSVSSEKNH